MQPQRALRLGLTGGIGSGKSTVAQLLARAGCAVVDADAISRQLTGAGGAAMPGIARRFGAGMVRSDGAMERDLMRALVFSDPFARGQLEAIIHPLVELETIRQTQDAESLGRRCIVFDVPLLVESGKWRRKVDQVLVVDCAEATQISRVLARQAMHCAEGGGWTADAVAQAMARQATRQDRLRAADICIFNDSVTLDQLAVAVEALAKRFGL